MSETMNRTGLGDELPAGMKPSTRPRIEADLEKNPISVWAGQPRLEKGFHKLDHAVFRGGVCDFAIKEVVRIRNARTTNCFL